jgi:ABC-2 type transport system ATP-binding protein
LKDRGALIEMRELTRKFGDKTAVDRVTMTAAPGQILGYLGPNGAGKTTTIKMLTGMIRPTGGKALVCGFDVQTDPVEVKRRIGVVPESGALYQSLTPGEYLELVGRLYGMEEKRIARRIDEFCEFFLLRDSVRQRMSEFSKGMRQKVVIISALMHDPQVLFLDEPLNGLDVQAVLLLKEYLRDLAGRGKTVFYSSHLLDVVENLCDRVVILNQGRITAEGSVGEIKKAARETTLEAAFNRLTHDVDPEKSVRTFSRKLNEDP